MCSVDVDLFSILSICTILDNYRVSANRLKGFFTCIIYNFVCTGDDLQKNYKRKTVRSPITKPRHNFQFRLGCVVLEFLF